MKPLNVILLVAHFNIFHHNPCHGNTTSTSSAIVSTCLVSCVCSHPIQHKALWRALEILPDLGFVSDLLSCWQQKLAAVLYLRSSTRILVTVVLAASTVALGAPFTAKGPWPSLLCLVHWCCKHSSSCCVSLERRLWLNIANPLQTVLAPSPLKIGVSWACQHAVITTGVRSNPFPL